MEAGLSLLLRNLRNPHPRPNCPERYADQARHCVILLRNLRNPHPRPNFLRRCPKADGGCVLLEILENHDPELDVYIGRHLDVGYTSPILVLALVALLLKTTALK